MKAKFLAVVLILSALFVTANQSYACPPPNQDPVAILTADPEYVMKDVNVTLDGSGSYDPDGDIEKYEWDWDYDPCVGFDCNYSETENDPGDDFDGITTHKYSTAGTYTVALRVTDDDNSEVIGTCMVYVNVKISVPNDVNTIQEAIVDANDGISTIVVSEGTYYENIDFKGKGITVTSTDPNSPDVVAATIITDDPCDPNVHVVTFKTSEDANSVLIGFTITDGDADGSGDEACGGGIYCDNASPTVRNCVIRDNKAAWSVDNGGGGGMYNDNNSNPSIINCVFSRNMASSTAPQTPLGYGGGIYNKESSPDVINCIFWGNFASHIGGGMYNEGLSSPRVINCVFADNYAASAGGGMANVYDIDSPSPTVTNCTFSGNYGGTGGGMFNSGSNAEVTNCIFWGNYGFDHEISPTEDINVSFSDVEGGYDGVSNIDSDPNFVDAVNPAGPDFVFSTWDDGLRIMAYSPCVDAADGNDAPETDITGRERFNVPYADNNGVGEPNYVDMGAYESPTVWFVDVNANPDGNGTSWDDAFDDLQDALVNKALDGNEIWVAKGTYKPDVNDPNNRSVSFELVEGVGVYGGFAGIEGIRDWISYKTTLSGDINDIGNPNDNSYHVVRGEADNAVLDGFTITGGNAGGGDWDGGGIYFWSYYVVSSANSPKISNCVITNNNSERGGGGGGMYIACYSPIVTNCFFSDNDANYGGGIYHHAGSKPILTNCVFSGNTASSNGGGMYSCSTGATLINCTFSGNKASIGGGMYESANSTMTNCILWGNEASDYHNQIVTVNSSISVSYSCIQEDSEPNDMSSYWKFDEGSGKIAYDSVGDNNGTLNGDTSWTTGQIDGALGFDGDGDYLDVGNPADGSLDFGTGNFSISAWVKQSDLGTFGGVFSKTSVTNGLGYGLHIEDENRFYFRTGIAGWDKTAVTSNTSISTDTWYHVVGVREDTTLKIYVNGSLDNSTTGTLRDVDNTVSAVIGRYYGNFDGHYHNGIIDDVRIYDRALSAEEVQQLYQNVVISIGEGNINDDPCFADANDPNGPDGIFGTSDDGLRLMADSPCIDAADGDPAPSTDILGFGRFDNHYVINTGIGWPDYAEIGAYEFPLRVVVMCWIDESEPEYTEVSTLYDSHLTKYQALINSLDLDGVVVVSGCLVPGNPITDVLPENFFPGDPPESVSVEDPPEGISIYQFPRNVPVGEPNATLNDFTSHFDRICDGIVPDYLCLSVDNSISLGTDAIDPSPDYPYTQFKNWINLPENYPNTIIKPRDEESGPEKWENEHWVEEMRIQVQSVLDEL